MKTLQLVPDLNPADMIGRKAKSLLPNGCKKILFINPSHVAEQDFDLNSAKLCCYSSTLPYGPGLLGRQLEAAGYTTDILDLNFVILWNAQHNPKFDYRVWQRSLRSKITSFKPDIIGISCMFSTMHSCMIEVIEYAKATYPHIPIIAGGVHTSGFTKLNLEKCKALDFVMRFESDRSFINFVKFINGACSFGELTQLSTLIDGEYVEISERATPNETELNITPNYHSLPIHLYSSVGMIGAYRWLNPDARSATVISNRGCRAKCTFCTVENFNGKGVRGRTIESVVEEIETLRNVHGINHFMWLDDDLFYDEKRMIGLFKQMANRTKPVTWEASNGVIASATTEEIVDACAESGCISLHFGIESGNSEILKYVRKPSGVRHYRKVGEIMKKHPQIFTRGFLMIGFKKDPPNFAGESIGNIWETINLAREIEMDWYSIQVVSYLGNTTLTKELLSKGLLNEQAIVDASFFVCAVGGQSQREKNEAEKAKPFTLDVLRKPKDEIPTEEEVKDIWFIMDFLVNYERLLRENRPEKLRLKHLFLKDICARKTRNNPLSTLFLGIIELKLGIPSATQRFMDAQKYMSESAFWDLRCRLLGLDKITSNILQTHEIPTEIKIY